MVWPDTIAWDHQGSIVFTADQLYKFSEGSLDFSEGNINFRIWSVFLGDGVDSYMEPTAAACPSVGPR